MVVTRLPEGTFFLKSIAVDFAGDIDWSVIPNELELFQVSLSLELAHDQPNGPWSASLELVGNVIVQNVTLSVSGQISIGDATSVSLAISAGYSSGATPEDVLNQFLGQGSGTKSSSKFQLPPTVQLPSNDENPFQASLKLSKDVSGWFVSNANVKVIWQTMYWNPLPDQSTDIVLQALYFEFLAHRNFPQGLEKPSDVEIAFDAAFGGSLMLYNIPLDAVVTYESATSSTVFICTIADQINLSLQDFASDLALSPSGALAGHNLNQEATVAPAPDAVPVDLTWCTSNLYGTQRYCIMTFQNSTLSRLKLRASFELDWQVTPLMTVAGMGIYFDIMNPVSTSPAPSIRGYAYGQVLLASNISLFAFVAGVSNSSTKQFLVGLSLASDPLSTIGMEPNTIFGDSSLAGCIVATDDWTLPLSFPSSASVGTVVEGVSSVNAQMSLRIGQSENQANPGSYITNLISLTASLSIAGTWEVFPGVTLTGLAMTVVVLPAQPSTNQPAAYYGELLGSVSTDLTTVGITVYTVVMAARVVRATDQSMRFLARVTAYLSNPDNLINLRQFLQMPLTGLNGIDVVQSSNASSVPSELPVQPDALLAVPAAQCSLTVEKSAAGWALVELNASLAQTTPWVIIEDNMIVTNSVLALSVSQPRSGQRNIQFLAQTTLTIGNVVDVTATISVVQVNSLEDTLTLALTVGDVQSIVGQLVGPKLTIPERCPLFNGNYSFSLIIICKRRSGGTGFELTSVSVRAFAAPGTSWTVGPLEITSLGLSATFDNINTGTMSTSIQFEGNAVMSGLPVDLLITYTSQTLTITTQTALEITQAVDPFVSGGLDSSLLDAPAITPDTGLSEYKKKPTMGIVLVFKYNSSWYPDSLSVVFASGTQRWVLVDPVLIADSLSLNLSLTEISTTKKLVVEVVLNFRFQKRPPQTDFGNLPCKLTANTKQLEVTVDTSQCTLPQFLYIATAGFWNPPDWLDFPAITPDTLRLRINWDEGHGEFEAILPDWDLSKNLPKLASMQKPRLQAYLTRSGSGFSATGQLAGEAM